MCVWNTIKRPFMFRLLILVFFFSACGIGSRGPNGAFEATGQIKPAGVRRPEALHLIKIFKNGYWMAAVFGDGYQAVYNIAGGVYSVKQGVLLARVDYSAGDTSAIGKIYDFKYSMDDGFLHESTDKQLPPGLSDLYQNLYSPIHGRESLRRSFLEGVWKIRDGQVGYTRNGDQYLKIYAYPRYAWVHYNLRQKRFIAAGGGTYQLNGDTLTEKVDYTTYKMAVGTVIKKMIRQYTWRSIMCFDVDSFYDEELWERQND